MFHKTRVMLSTVAISFTMVLSPSGCRDRNVVEPAITSVPSPTPSIDRTQLAPEAQQNPFKQYAPGLLARTIYKAEQTGDLEVEVWELLVGPGKKSEAAKVPGAAVAEVRSGSGVVTIGEKRRDIKSGTGFSIDDGEAFQIENSSQEEGLALRVVLIRSH